MLAVKHNILLCLLFLFFFSTFVSSSSYEEKIEVDFHSLDTIRNLDSPIPASVVVKNMNYNKNVKIKEIRILEGDEIILSEEINEKIKPLQKYIKRRDKLLKYLQEPQTCKNSKSFKNKYYLRKYERIVKKIEKETLDENFMLDMIDFGARDVVNISVEIDVKVAGKKYTLTRLNSIRVIPRLPIPPHNSPGWYAGDLHIHSDFGETYFGILDPADSLDEMTAAAISQDLDWVIFTDHSVGFETADEWEAGRDACLAESTDSFKCLYGQEMSIGKTVGCDALFNGHYLAHPSSDDDLGWINGSCVFGGCSCRDEQTVIDEINVAGGIGSVAHPYMGFFDWDSWDVLGVTGIEIINWEFDTDDAMAINNPDIVVNSWREFLVSEDNPADGFVRGTAGSDAHKTNEVGHGSFNYCYIDSEILTTEAIRKSVSEGHCVATTGPFLSFTLGDNIVGDVVGNVLPGNKTLNIQADSTGFGELEIIFVFIDDVIEEGIFLSGETYEETIEISLDVDDNYIRLELHTEDGGRAFTNPIWVGVVDMGLPLFEFRGNGSEVVASFSDNGNLNLKGECLTSSNCVAPQDSLIFQDSDKMTVAYIDNGGNICLETGECGDSEMSCNPSEDAFVVQGPDGENLSYIDFSGGMCLIGDLNEEVSF